jgi:oxalate decarboxylase/phosphoglucose isomerase-like protein (cupin superfamily)
MKKINNKRYICNVDEVETWVLPWGGINVLSENMDDMGAILVNCSPGMGHERHNHTKGTELLYILEGEGEQTIEIDGIIEKQKICKGDLVTIPQEVFHSTINTGSKPLVILAIYQFNQKLKRDSSWKIVPPKR